MCAVHFCTDLMIGWGDSGSRVCKVVLHIDGFGVNQLSGKDSYGTLPSGLRLAFSGVLSSRSNCSRRSLSLTSSARSSTRCNVRRRRHIAVLHPLDADLMVLLVCRNLLKTRHKDL